MALVVGGLLALCIASGTAIAIFGPPNSGTESQTANTARPSSATATERPAGPAPQAVQPTAGVPSSPAGPAQSAVMPNLVGQNAAVALRLADQARLHQWATARSILT